MKMKNITKYIVAVFVSLTTLVSCNLDLVPTTAIVYDEDVPAMQTLDDIVGFYNGVLASYRSLCSGSFDITTDVMVDYFNATKDFGNNYGPVHRLDASFTTGDNDVESIWASHYSAIKNYNVVIEQADKVESEELKDAARYVQAVAYFCRASAYLTLTRLWGEVYEEDTAAEALSVPLILSYDINNVPSRATVEDVYAQIDSDLTFAEDIYELELVLYGYVPQPITIDAVNALWARYYLDTKDYKNAYKKALAVIGSEAGYKLASNAQEMMAEYLNDSGTEPIVQLYADKSEGTVSRSVYTLVGFDENEGNYFAPYFLPSQNLLDAYDPADLRLSSWFTNKKYMTFMQGSFHDGISVFVKFIGNQNLYTGSLEQSANAAKPLMISEMYLIAAEAAYMDNGTVNINSDKYLGELQKARGATVTSGTLENIKKEWYREMVGYGQRFVCLKRWGDGIGARNIQDEAAAVCMDGEAYDQRTIAADSHIFNLPIPAYEIKITPSLGQNDGYSAN